MVVKHVEHGVWQVEPVSPALLSEMSLSVHLKMPGKCGRLRMAGASTARTSVEPEDVSGGMCRLDAVCR